jgi:hypothetical protein
LQDSLLPGASVVLFNNADDANDSINVQRAAITGANGLVVFSQLDSSKYILRVSSATVSSQQEIETPNNSVTKLDVLL